jgi:ribosomal RNA methyltransferase Nop2
MSELGAALALFYGYSEELTQYFLDLLPVGEAIQLFEANEKKRPMTLR